MVAERFHGPLITVEPRLRLTHVLERSKSRSRQCYPQVEIVRDLQQFLASPVDVVAVLTPNELHFEQARQALLAGKHVVLDKPMTVTASEADELVTLAQTQNRLLTVFHNRRWDSDFLTLRRILSEGSLGRLVELESHFDRFRPAPKGGWREERGAGTGVLYDLGSHLLDQVLFVFGTPRRLWAEVRSQRVTEADDFFEVVLDYGELRVTLKASCVAAEPKLRFLARGSQGAWMKYGMDPQEDALAAGATPGGADWGVDLNPGTFYRAEGSEVVACERGNYPAFYAQLAAALLEGASPPVPPEQARDVIRALELCLESHRRGCWIEF